MGSTRKDVTDLVKEARRQGWTAADRGQKVMLRSPDKQHIVVVHKTPSDRRWLANAYRDLRAAGFIVPNRPTKQGPPP